MSFVLNGVLACRGAPCQRENHIYELDELFSDVLDCICLAGMVLPTRNVFQNYNRVIGWNDHCKILYAEARKKFFEWHEVGRLRDGSSFENMKFSRAAFKNALNYCRKNEAQIRKEIL